MLLAHCCSDASSAASSLLSSLLLDCADELARIHGRADDLLREADPSIATELLPDYERDLGEPSTGAPAERRARVVSRLVRRQRFRPVDFQVALAPLLGQAPAEVVVIERTRAFCVAVGDDREIYRFFIFRAPSLPGVAFLASAQAMVDRMAPSHTQGHVIESINFQCDDPHSLCDRDLLGA
ncbi:MAG TPA: putative phage tail protein [Kofleriaceae bacterium]|nr:putative phage tail protein [Kofleriaceae bacterium]